MASETYRSKNGQHYFKFRFVQNGSICNIYCDKHPGFNGKNTNPEKTHLFRSGKICFYAGKEPANIQKARKLAGQWAEYMLEYRRTGITQ
ncbi:MAG: hypothetical protein JEZ07_07340 [Phycisphaerae bacterium]|nr:hypothetical protein [Phycisphaerae bacterium]